MEKYKLHLAAQDLADYLDEINVKSWDRDEVRERVTKVNEAYFAYAYSVDKPQVQVLE